MIQQLTLHRKLRFIFALLFGGLLLNLSGCDSRNDADMPPFGLAARYPLPAIARDVAACGDMVAIADNTAGTIVLNVHDLAHIDSVYRDTVKSYGFPDPHPGFSTFAGIDTIHHYVYTGTDNTDEGNYYAFRIRDYLTGRGVTGIGFTGPGEDILYRASSDTITIWITDITETDGFGAYQVCRENDSAPWSSLCGFNFTKYTVPRHPDHPAVNTLHGFGRRDDGVFALSQSEWGVHLCTDNGNPISDVITRGTAFDCAWSGNYIVVADEILVTVIDATELSHPFVLSSLLVPSADRLEKVVVNYPFAFVMDVFDGIYVFDVSNPNSIKFVQLLNLSQPTSLFFDNQRLYVTDEAQGLMIYTHH